MSIPANLSRVEVLTIGDELLDGRVADTNTLLLAKLLSPMGAVIAQRCSVPDQFDAIIAEAKAIAKRGTTLCFVSGGLGPTSDDITAQAFAMLLEVPLQRDIKAVAAIKERLSRFGSLLNESQLKQADLPQGAVLLENNMGTAPGFSVLFKGCQFICLPGVPKELRQMAMTLCRGWEKGISSAPREKLYLQTFGQVEGDLNELLRPIKERFPDVTVGYRAKFPVIQLTFFSEQGITPSAQGAQQFAKKHIGYHAIYAEEDKTLPQVMVAELLAKGKTLAVAESCSGGLLSSLITDQPGVSGCFLGGVVAYHNDVKQNLLNISEQILNEDGAVSERCAKEMARGVRVVLGADFGLAITGIAGPSGGTDDKPVGTIWLAVAGPDGVLTRHLQLPYDRTRNRIYSAYSALMLLRGCMDTSFITSAGDIT